MKKATVTGKELMEEYETGFITSDFHPKVLVQDAIINEDYDDFVNIVMTNINNEDCQIRVKIKDFLTPKEHAEVLKLNWG